MRASTNIALKERRTIVLDNFRGLDLSSSPLKIKNYHAAEMENLISIDGVNQKRPGWHELIFTKDQIAAEGPRRVNGIFGLDEGMLLHIGSNIYFANSNKRILLQTGLPNAPSQAFYKDDKCYLVTGKGIFVFQKDSDGQYFFEPIEKNAYVPTTSISINAESKNGDSVRSSLDDVNLLTPWRKNSLLGAELNVTERDSEGETVYSLSPREWVLDGTADISKKITVEILLESNLEEEPLILETSETFGKLQLAEGATYDGAVEIDTQYVDLSAKGQFRWWNVFIPEGGIRVTDDFPIGTLLKQKVTNQTDGSISYIYARVVKEEIDSEIESANPQNAKIWTYVPVDYADLYGSIINYGEGAKTRLRLNINTKPRVGGADNITIKFNCPQNIELGQNNSMPAFEQKNMITLCSFGVLFGAEGGRDRLFLSGNPFYPNIDFWSEADDFTYFPANNFAKVGSENTSISGYAKLTDNTLAIFKSQNTRRASDKTAESYVYYRTGANNVSTDEEGNIKNFSTIFKLREGAIGEELASRHSIVNLSGDVLMLSTSGVYGLIRSDNLNSMEYNAIERSSLISSSIRKQTASDYISSDTCYLEPLYPYDATGVSWHPQLNRCAAVAYKNRYYLALPNEDDYPCFVADARYKTSGSNSSYGYEWWKWTNIPAITWAVIDDRLYFGTSDGRICLFDNELEVAKYCDSTASNLLPGKILLKTLTATDYNNTPIYLDGASDGATVRLTDCAEVLGKVSTVKDRRFYVSADIIQKIYVGRKIRFKGIAFGDDVEYEVVDVDYYSNSFQLKYGATVVLYDNHIIYSPIDFDVYVKGTPDNCTLHRAMPTDNNIDEAYMQPMRIIDLLPSEERVSFGEIRYHKNIAASWTSGTLDLGTNAYSKTLLRLVLGVGDACGKDLHFGYQTRNSDFVVWHGARGIGHFAFDSLDFENFSFDKDFTTSFAIKCNERNFNYIRFRLMSNSDSNFAVNSITVIYKINKQNLGVR